MSHDDWDGVYLWIDSDDLAALVAVVGEDILVALDAVGVVVPQDVTVASQGVVAVVAKHLLFVKCLLATCKVFDWAEMKRLHWTKARPFFEKRKYSSRQKLDCFSKKTSLMRRLDCFINVFTWITAKLFYGKRDCAKFDECNNASKWIFLSTVNCNLRHLINHQMFPSSVLLPHGDTKWFSDEI